MLKKHKNALLDAIKACQFDVLLFYSKEERPVNEQAPEEKLNWWSGLWSILAGEVEPARRILQAQPVFTVGLKNTALTFKIRNSHFSFDEFEYQSTRFSPVRFVSGWKKTEEWSRVHKAFNEWLTFEVQECLSERELPDGWAQLDAYKSFVTNSPPLKSSVEDRTPFTEEEKETARQSINRFRGFLHEQFKPSADQSNFINERLDYLSQAIDRLSRVDWRGVALSTVVTIGANLTVDTDKGHLLFSLFQQAFQTATHLLKN